MKLCEEGVIKPYRESNGRGTNRLFDFKNLIEIGIAEQLYSIQSNNSASKIAVEAFSKLNDKDKIYIALSSAAVRGTKDINDKFYISQPCGPSKSAKTTSRDTMSTARFRVRNRAYFSWMSRKFQSLYGVFLITTGTN